MSARIEISVGPCGRTIDLIADDGTHLDSWEPAAGTPSRRLALAMADEIDQLRATLGAVTAQLDPRLCGCGDVLDGDTGAQCGNCQAGRESGLELRIDELTATLRDLYDPSDCSHDHHGYCQAHGWLEEGVCPMRRAKDLFAHTANATT